MSLKLGDYLNSINVSKVDVMDSEDVVKAYPAFVVARSLSYHRNCIHLVQMLNQMNVDNRMHYDFLLNTIPRGKKFAPWAKPVKVEHVDDVARYYGCSKKVAMEYIELLSDEDLERIRSTFDEGGVKK